MARPHKVGLDYFSFDVDFFENKKVRKILRGCGPGSVTVLTCLLCNIYRFEGYYMKWDEDSPFDAADKIGVSEGTVTEVVNKAIQVKFFSPTQFDQNKILTSWEIQNRYKSATANRSEVVFNENFIVLKDDNEINDGDNPVITPDNTQSKVKDSKVNESKGKSFVARGDDQARQQQLKKDYEALLLGLKDKDRKEIWTGLKAFIQDQKPDFAEPVVDAWNLFASTYKLSEVRDISQSRRKKYQTRSQESSFDFLKILEKIKTSAHLKGDNQQGWKVTFDWILENDKNYLKILEGNYD